MNTYICTYMYMYMANTRTRPRDPRRNLPPARWAVPRGPCSAQPAVSALTALAAAPGASTPPDTRAQGLRALLVTDRRFFFALYAACRAAGLRPAQLPPALEKRLLGFALPTAALPTASNRFQPLPTAALPPARPPASAGGDGGAARGGGGALEASGDADDGGAEDGAGGGEARALAAEVLAVAQVGFPRTPGRTAWGSTELACDLRSHLPSPTQAHSTRAPVRTPVHVHRAPPHACLTCARSGMHRSNPHPQPGSALLVSYAAAAAPAFPLDAFAPLVLLAPPPPAAASTTAAAAAIAEAAGAAELRGMELRGVGREGAATAVKRAQLADVLSSLPPRLRAAVGPSRCVSAIPCTIM
jgi:hypothetical protein